MTIPTNIIIIRLLFIGIGPGRYLSRFAISINKLIYRILHKNIACLII